MIPFAILALTVGQTTLADLKVVVDTFIKVPAWMKSKTGANEQLGKQLVSFIVQLDETKRPAQVLWAEFPTTANQTAGQVLEYLTPQHARPYEIGLLDHTLPDSSQWVVRLKVSFGEGTIGRILVLADKLPKPLKDFNWQSAKIWSLHLNREFTSDALSQQLAWNNQVKLPNGQNAKFDDVFLRCAPWR